MRPADVTAAAVSREALGLEFQEGKLRREAGAGRAERDEGARCVGLWGSRAGETAPGAQAERTPGSVRPRMPRATLLRTRRGLLRGGSCGEAGGAGAARGAAPSGEDAGGLVPASSGLRGAAAAAAARGAGPAARRRDVTVAAAVVGAGSAAAKCELRRARAAGGGVE